MGTYVFLPDIEISNGAIVTPLSKCTYGIVVLSTSKETLNGRYITPTKVHVAPLKRRTDGFMFSVIINSIPGDKPNIPGMLWKFLPDSRFNDFSLSIGQCWDSILNLGFSYNSLYSNRCLVFKLSALTESGLASL